VSGPAVDVEKLVRDLGIESSVDIRGEVRDIIEQMAEVDFVLVPSVRPDPLPTIAIEAAAAGRCVLASRTGGLPEIVVDGVSGMLLGANDMTTWAKVLGTIDRDVARQYGAAARDVYEERFRSTAYRLRLESVLAPVFEDSRPQRNRH
jgi:glycosyltransferase involved in cell wall biosynthesis